MAKSAKPNPFAKGGKGKPPAKGAGGKSGKAPPFAKGGGKKAGPIDDKTLGSMKGSLNFK